MEGFFFIHKLHIEPFNYAIKSVCFDFHSTNLGSSVIGTGRSESSPLPYFYWFRCYYPLITYLNPNFCIFSIITKSQMTIVLSQQSNKKNISDWVSLMLGCQSLILAEVMKSLPKFSSLKIFCLILSSENISSRWVIRCYNMFLTKLSNMLNIFSLQNHQS